MIPYGKQDICQADIDAVVEVLKSDFLTQGPKVPLFEKLVGDKVGAKHAVAVNSATSALHVACMALGLDKNSWLWTSPISFVASANCGLYCGAHVDFVDIDSRTNNLCPVALKSKLIVAEKAGILPTVVVVVHLGGQPCDMRSIHALSERYGFRVIEDASHAIGGKYENEYIGNCRFSDVTVFSFHPVKIITTAEGGMALTNDSGLAKKMNLHRSHGVTRDPSLMVREPDGPWYYEQIDLGYNYRMTELQAALGISQVNRLDAFVARRHALADRYDYLLQDLPVVVPRKVEHTYSGLHLYVIRLKLEDIDRTHSEVFAELRAAGIGVNLHYIPIHIQPYYELKGFRPESFPEAIRYYSEAISLPMYYGLSNSQQDHIVRNLRRLVMT